eukprot:4694660-Prymnesium_polylepis.1
MAWFGPSRLYSLVINARKRRPLAVPAALLRAAGACMLRQMRPDLASYLTTTRLTLDQMAPPA